MVHLIETEKPFLERLLHKRFSLNGGGIFKSAANATYLLQRLVRLRCKPLETTKVAIGVLGIPPRKGIFQNEIRESHAKNYFALFPYSNRHGIFQERHIRVFAVS